MRKKLLLGLFVFALSLAGHAFTVIDPDLQKEMTRHNDDERMEVVVLMKSQYDRAQLSRMASYFPTQKERRAFVVNELKTFSEASQHDLRSILAEMEQQGMVASVQSLWSANALYFEATKPAILELATRADIATISLNMQHQWIPEGETVSVASSSREVTPNITQVHADQVWEQGYTGQGVVVAEVNIAGGMEWAVEHGCDLISMSLGMVDAGVADKEI